MRLRSERGSAMMEFVLSLPFLWLIIALALGFGAGVLSRHRLTVVVREHGFTDASDANLPQREAELLRAMRFSGAYSVQNTGSGLGGGGGLDLVRGLLAKASNAHKLCFEGSRRPTVKVLPQIAVSACFEVDSNFWTYDETKDERTAMIGAALGGAIVGSFLGF